MNSDLDVVPLSAFVHPRYWGTWLLIGFLRVLSLLPYRVLMVVGQGFGWLSYYLAKKRRRIAEVNVDLCFPELTVTERHLLVKKTVQENVLGFFESIYAWWGDASQLKSRVDISGLEHLEALKKQNKGAMLVGAHYSNLDLGGFLVSLFADVDVTYRSHNNPLFNQIIIRGRAPNFGRVLERSQLRDMIRRLRAGNVLWYAADQDYGRKHSVFAPFFGIEAATVNGTAKLAKMCRVPVLILGHQRQPNGRYLIDITPVLEGFPSGNDRDDAMRINAELEKQIRRYPEQYLWVHRRFKTRPEKTEPSFYR